MAKKIDKLNTLENKMVDWLASLLFNNYLINFKRKNYAPNKTTKRQ